MTVVTDSFNRANETPLASPWQVITGKNNFLLSSNTATPNGLGTDAIMLHTGMPTTTGDQYAQAAVTVVGTTSEAGLGLFLRGATSGLAPGGYWIITNDLTNNCIYIASFVSGSYLLLAQRDTGSGWADGDVLRAEIRGIDLAATIKVLKNGVQVGADIVPNVTTNADTGRPGIAYSSALTSASLDNFEAGDLIATSMLVPHHPHGMGAGRW